MHTRFQSSAAVLAATVVFAAGVVGCDDPDNKIGTGPSDPATSETVVAASLDPATNIDDRTGSADVLEALSIGSTVVPARLSSLTSGDGAIWASGDGGTIVRIVDGQVDEISVDGVEGTVRPTFTPDGSWWADVGGSVVVRVDPNTLAVDEPVQVGPPVGNIVIGPDGRLWIEATQPPAGLRLFDPTTGAAGEEVVLAESDEVVGTASAGGSLWAPLFGSNQLLRLDADLGIVESIPTGVGPATARAVGESIWWTNRTDGTLGRLDIESGTTTTVDLNVVTPVEQPSAVTATSEDVWVVAATIADRVGVVFRIDATTGEVVGARTLPGRRSVDELGGMTALGDRLFVLFATSGELVELDVDDFTAVADPDRPTPTTAPMSEDEVEIRDVVSTLFSSATPPDQAVELVEHGEELGDVFTAFRQFFTDNFDNQTVAAEVFGVRVIDDTAEADYVVTVSGGPIVDIQTGALTRTDEGWRFTEASLCALVALGGITCP